MPDTSTELLDQKVVTLRQISELGDFRPGSVSTTTGRGGNPNCRYHRVGASGHGRNFRRTYQTQGKTITESFYSPAAKSRTRNRGVPALAKVMLMDINIPIRISQATLRPGDVAVTDPEGVTFVPPQLCEKVADKAELAHLVDDWGHVTLREQKYTPGRIDGR